MTCSIKATIPTFEELTDSDGKIYTVSVPACLDDRYIDT